VFCEWLDEGYDINNRSGDEQDDAEDEDDGANPSFFFFFLPTVVSNFIRRKLSLYCLKQTP
jgi:hypothetical protein